MVFYNIFSPVAPFLLLCTKYLRGAEGQLRSVLQMLSHLMVHPGIHV